MKMIQSGHMDQNKGYQITEEDIVTAIRFLKSENKPSTREDAIKYLEEKAALAHVVAHKLVEDEKSGKIKPVEVEND